MKGDYWDWLAEARSELGENAEALRAYEKVRERGVWSERLTIFTGAAAARIACCHAELGDTDAALAALADALRSRFRNLDLLRDDEHLASVRDDLRFAELLGVPDVEGLGRDEGWRGSGHQRTWLDSDLSHDEMPQRRQRASSLDQHGRQPGSRAPRVSGRTTSTIRHRHRVTRVIRSE